MNWMVRLAVCGIAVMACLFHAKPGFAQAEFLKQVSDVKVGDVAPMTAAAPLKVPFITWGGDIATFHANGGLKTAEGTIFAKQGLNLELAAGDDFTQQVKDYISGKSPFLRGTFSMIGMASDVIGKNDRTKGVVILQLTWSKGDHLVGRKDWINKLDGLKGKTICLQQGGPHVGMLDDLLLDAKLGWDDIKVVWAKDLTASKERPNDNPAAMFRTRPDIDACFVISPDMSALCGGSNKSGAKGVEGQVEGSHIIISTATMSRSIADVYVCRKDFFDANKDLVQKFVTGYLKGCEDLSGMFTEFGKPNGAKAAKDSYQKIREMTQGIYGKEAIPTLEDVDGLLSDCEFANYGGNVAFFTGGEGNKTGFEVQMKKWLDLAQGQQYATIRRPLLKAEFDYKGDAYLKYLASTGEIPSEVNAEATMAKIKEITDADLVNDMTVVSYLIPFDANQITFPEDKYAQYFERAITTTAKYYPNAALVVRGHVDPQLLYTVTLNAAKKKGLIKFVPDPTDASHQLPVYNGEAFEFEKLGAKKLIQLIDSGVFEPDAGAPVDKSSSPKALLAGTQKLSDGRATAVRDAIIAYAKSHNLKADASMFVAQGMGTREPLVLSSEFVEAKSGQNRRVEFRLIRVDGETKAAAAPK